MNLFFAILFLGLPFTGMTQAQRNALVSHLEWSPNGTLIAEANNLNVINIHNIATSELITTLTGHTQEIMALSWNPTGDRIVSGSPDGTLRVWDVLTGDVVQLVQFSQPTGSYRAVLDLDWNYNGTLIASAHDNNQIRIWNANTGEQIANYSHEFMPLTLDWHPTMNLLTSGSIDGTLLIWNAGTNQVSEFTPISRITNPGSINSVAWNSTGSQLAIATNEIGVQIFDFATQILDQEIPISSHDFFTILWSPNDRNIAIMNNSLTQIVNSETGIAIDVIQSSSQNWPDNVSWSPFGGQLAIVGVTSSWDQLQFTVPDISLENLLSISELCALPLSIEQAISSRIQENQLSSLVTQIESLPADSIPPACAADLIAVAEAIQNQ